MLEAFPPESYRRLSFLMRRGKGYRAPGPCAIPGCTYAARGEPDAATEGWEWDKPKSPPFVWDHCHAHDYVRGSLCRYHNGQMRWLDARIADPRREAELMAHWLRCPNCEAGGWEPMATRLPLTQC